MLAAVWAPRAYAISSYYTNNCAGCHGSSVNTCNGCHAHGTHGDSSKSSINLSAVTDKTSYSPGEAMTVTVTGGYRNGWVRVILLDQNMAQIGIASCPGGEGGCTTSVFPITFPRPGATLTAPTTPGTYTFAAAWYGNGFDAGGASFGSGTSATLRPGFFTPDSGNSVPVEGVDTPHGWQTVATNSFTVTAPAVATIALNPGSLNFGNVNVGTTSSLSTQVQNTGTAVLNVSAINRCTSPATSTEFTWSPAAPFSVNPGASATLTVSYAPGAAGMDTGCLALTSNASNGPTTNLAVSGTGVVPPAPRIAVSPPSLSFGNVTVGTASPMTLTVSNTGNAPLTGSITRAASTSIEFTFSPASFNVAAGGSQPVTVTYTPSAVGSDTGSLVVSSNDTTNPSVSVALSGAGVPAPAPHIALNPTSLSFGTVTVGGSNSLTTQVQNTGTAPLNVTAIALCTSPATSPEFGWSPVAPFTVPAGGSNTVTVTYTPTAAGADSGCLAFSSNDAANPTVTLAVSGTGQLLAAPHIAVSPTSLGFGNVTVGTPSSQTFTISNTGNATLTGTIARASGSTEFTFTPSSFNVAAGGSQGVSVTYAPSAAGADTGSLTVSSNDAANPNVSVALSGTGVSAPTPSIALSPPSLSFGTVVLGSSASLSTQIQNTGTAVLNVTGIALCAGTSGEFAWTPSAPLSVPPGQSATLTVTYTPTAAAADSGCLAIASNDPASPTVNLGVSGTGAGQPFPAIALVPSSLSFGTVTIGSSASRTTQVQNTGNATLNVLGISLCSGTPAKFTWSPAAPLAVAPGQAATLTVTYTPTDAVVDSGCLAIASDDPQNATVNLQLTGTGSQVQVAGLDIDIGEFEVPRYVNVRRTSSIGFEVEVRNRSLVDGTAPATLVGVLGGVEVYRQTIDITLQAGREGEYHFPRYAISPGARGTISWTLTVDDQDPDIDRATARTSLFTGTIGGGEDDLVASVTGSSTGGGTVTAGCGSAGGEVGSLAPWALVLLAAARRRRGRGA
ncbi:MAG TPA: choice-of-anchor D domain-containing protein [Anaeromyxobacteraceae bacterium]|nr:choice-of-anchor D domain-containing protein [Anaeromyxobacteraceae bacterium]